MMSNLRDKVVFQWPSCRDNWHMAPREFKDAGKKFIVLPDGTLLEHSGHYTPTTLVSLAAHFSYTDLKEVKYERGTRSLKEIAEAYDAVLAEITTEQHTWLLDEEY